MLTQDLDPGGGAAPQGSPADPPPRGPASFPCLGGDKGQTLEWHNIVLPS